MEKESAARALECLEDYGADLWCDGKRKHGRRQKGDLSSGDAPGLHNWSAFEPSAGAISASVYWEKRKEREWRKAGRIGKHGKLKADGGPLPPWTRAKVAAIFPRLDEFSIIALLIDLDGEIERGYMDQHENIRNTLIGIIDLRVAQHLGGALAYLKETGVAKAPTPDNPPQLPGALKNPTGASPVSRGKRQYRKRHPKTGELIPREEYDRIVKEQDVAAPAEPPAENPAE